MKKYVLSLLTLALFGIGFTSSDDSETKTSAQEEVSTNTEEKESTEKLTPKEQEVADAGYQKGVMFAYASTSNPEFASLVRMVDQEEIVSNTLKETADNEYRREYNKSFTAPLSDKDKHLKEIYTKYFIKGLKETLIIW